MKDLLQQIDSDYYRSALLLVLHTELERLREGRSALVDVRRQSKTTFGTPCSTDSCVQSLVPHAIVQSCSLEVDTTG
jgi:hypothetical protein